MKPHDELIELNVLTAMVDSQQAADVAVAMLTHGDFYTVLHSEMFQLLRQMIRDNVGLDFITLRAAIDNLPTERQEPLKSIAAKMLREKYGNPANIEEYCQQLRDMTKHRAALEAAEKLNHEAKQGKVSAKDFFKVGRDLEAADNTSNTGQTSALEAEIQAAKSGERFAVPFPWPELSRATRALLPGTVTIICGNPGASKSFALLQAISFWVFHGFKTACLMLEDGTTYHMRRALAQMSGCSDLTSDDWIKANPEHADALLDKFRIQIAALGASLFDMPSGIEPTIDAALDWMEARARDGCRIICIDPYSMLDNQGKPWHWDKVFISKAKRIVEEYRISLVIINHPKDLSGRNELTLDDMGGGKALSRFGHTVIWFEPHSEKQQTLEREGEKIPGGMITFDRTALILKARNGPGAWRKIAMTFERDSLTLTEQGMIERDAV